MIVGIDSLRSGKWRQESWIIFTDVIFSDNLHFLNFEEVGRAFDLDSEIRKHFVVVQGRFQAILRRKDPESARLFHVSKGQFKGPLSQADMIAVQLNGEFGEQLINVLSNTQSVAIAEMLSEFDSLPRPGLTES